MHEVARERYCSLTYYSNVCKIKLKIVYKKTKANVKYSCLWCNVEGKFRHNIRTRRAHTMEALTSTLPTPSQEEERINKAAMSYDAQHNPEISGELERPMMKKLLSCIRDCGVTFSVYLEDDGGFSFTSLVDGDKKEVAIQTSRKAAELLAINNIQHCKFWYGCSRCKISLVITVY